LESFLAITTPFYTNKTSPLFTTTLKEGGGLHLFPFFSIFQARATLSVVAATTTASAAYFKSRV
jgi:hypothetical protein